MPFSHTKGLLTGVLSAQGTTSTTRSSCNLHLAMIIMSELPSCLAINLLFLMRLSEARMTKMSLEADCPYVLERALSSAFTSPWVARVVELFEASIQLRRLSS